MLVCEVIVDFHVLANKVNGLNGIAISTFLCRVFSLNPKRHKRQRKGWPHLVGVPNNRR